MTQGIKAAAVILMAAFIAAPALATSTMAKNMKVLSFKDPAMLKATDAQFIASTTNGKGTKMPAYKDKLTSAQIKDVVAYIRTLQK